MPARMYSSIRGKEAYNRYFRLCIAYCVCSGNTFKLVPGHTGAAVIVAEGQHVTVGLPGALSIPARSIV